jgi:hypothetical protein
VFDFENKRLGLVPHIYSQGRITEIITPQPDPDQPEDIYEN